MQEIIDTCIWIVCAIVILTLIYRIIPYKTWTNKKPSLVFFPKYRAEYSIPLENIIANIKNNDFNLIPDSGDIYTRGKVYGDFSTKLIQLQIKVDTKQKTIKIYAPFFGVLFDTGDLWRIVSEILNE